MLVQTSHPVQPCPSINLTCSSSQQRPQLTFDVGPSLQWTSFGIFFWASLHLSEKISCATANTLTILLRDLLVVRQIHKCYEVNSKSANTSIVWYFPKASRIGIQDILPFEALLCTLSMQDKTLYSLSRVSFVVKTPWSHYLEHRDLIDRTPIYPPSSFPVKLCEALGILLGTLVAPLINFDTGRPASHL